MYRLDMTSLNDYTLFPVDYCALIITYVRLVRSKCSASGLFLIAESINSTSLLPRKAKLCCLPL